MITITTKFDNPIDTLNAGYPCIAVGKSKATFVLPDRGHALLFKLKHGGVVKEAAWVDLLVQTDTIRAKPGYGIDYRKELKREMRARFGVPCEVRYGLLGPNPGEHMQCFRFRFRSDENARLFQVQHGGTIVEVSHCTPPTGDTWPNAAR